MSLSPNISTATIAGKDYGLVAFYYPGHNTSWDDYYQASFLGNFWQVKIQVTIDGITSSFYTAEAAFQATKWWHDTDIRDKFAQAKSGAEAFRIKKHLDVAADYGYAGLGRDGAMQTVLEAKFSNSDLKSGLLATGDSYLLEHNAHHGLDSYWSDDHNGDGQNMLGKTLMKIRKSLGGSDSTYEGKVLSMTQNVRYGAPASRAFVTLGKIKVIPSVYQNDGEDGDFGWMIKQDKYKDALFIFNDNKSQFEDHIDDPAGISGCSIGGGNAVIRPYQCQSPPKAAGIPTGPGFSGLTADVKTILDLSISEIKKSITAGSYKAVVYSSNGHGGLGTSIFKVPQDVKDYIVSQIEDLANY